MKVLIYILLNILSIAPLYSQVWFQGGEGSGFSLNDTSYCEIDSLNLVYNSTVLGSGGNNAIVSYCDSNDMLVLYQADTTARSGFSFSEFYYCTNEPYVGTEASGFNNNLALCLLVLPVELIYFDAIALEREVQLNWETISEINNDYFTIQKTDNLADWIDVLTVDGAGNSMTNIKYVEYDYSPLSGTSYYRLKQTDFDGSYTFSNIVSVTYFTNSSLNVFPNPTTQLIHINNSSIKYNETNSEINIYDHIGRDVTNKTNISFTENQITINLLHLPNGIYHLKINNNTVKIIKM